MPWKIYFAFLLLLLIPSLATAQVSPAREWGTYYYNNRTYINSITTDPRGNVYFAGYTITGGKFKQFGETIVTPSLGTPNSFRNTLYQTDTAANINNVKPDAFLTKFSSAGVCLWSTYYGGPGYDVADIVRCDAAGNVYLAGRTNSTVAIATTGSLQGVQGGDYDGFLVKFDSSGTRLWGTYYGGAGTDEIFAIAIDPGNDDNIYVGGSTISSSGISTSGSYQPVFAGGTATDAFIAKFNGNGQRQWASYYGDTLLDVFNNMVCDAAGNIYTCGITTSQNHIASPGSHQPASGGGSAGQTPLGTWDAFMIKFNPAGQRIWGTYYGGNQTEDRSNIAYDRTSNSIYLAGITSSANNMATPGSFQDINYTTGISEFDAFLAKFDTAGVRQWGTYYGGAGGVLSTTTGLNCDTSGNVYLSETAKGSINIATPGSYQDTLCVSADAFLVKFSGTGNRIWGTYYGGTQYEYTRGQAVDNNGSIYLAGGSSSDSVIATPGSFQDSRDANLIAPNAVAGTLPFIVKFHDCLPDASITGTGGHELCAGDSMILHANNLAAQSYQWQKDGTDIANATDTVFHVHASGIYRLIVSIGNGCTNTSAPDTIVVHPLPAVTIAVNNHVLHTTTPFVTYQWNLNGQAISGATNATYIAAQNGHYSVTVTDANGCKATSAVLAVSDITGINNPVLGGSIHIYPNPTQSVLHIDAPVAVTVSVCSMEGRLLLTEQDTKQISVGALPAGVYLLKIRDKKGNLLKTERFVKNE